MAVVVAFGLTGVAQSASANSVGDSIMLMIGEDWNIQIDFLGVEYDFDQNKSTWTYKVTEKEGSRDLSHWNILLGDCFAHYIEGSGTPDDPNIEDDFETGNDGSTGTSNVLKWNVEEDFVMGEFSFMLDGLFGIGAVDVLVKGGNERNGGGESRGQIHGPDCGVIIPTPAAAFGGLSMLGMFAARRRR